MSVREPDQRGPNDRPARPLWAVVVGAAALFLAVGSVSASIAAGWDWGTYVSSYTFTNTVIGAAFASSGAMIGWARPRNAVATAFMAAGIAHLVSAALAPILWAGLIHGWPGPVLRLLAGVFLGAWGLGLPSLGLLALLLFPDGRPPGRKWTPAVWYLVALGVVRFFTGILGPGEIIPGQIASRPFFAWDGMPVEAVSAATGILSLPAIVLVVASLVLRYIRGDERTRRQLLWLLLAVLGMIVINLQRWITGDGSILLLLSTALIPIAIAIAILRYRLLDIRVVLSRTLLYGTLIALVLALYAGIVAAFTALVPSDADRAVAAIAAVVVALLVNPLRLLLQRAVARSLFGTRDDPARTVATVANAVGLDDVLSELRRTLRLPRLEITADGDAVGAAGAEPEDPVRVGLPLSGSAVLGVSLRPGEKRLHEADRRSLELVIPAMAALLREKALIGELRRARAQTAEARERERQVLHRNLHDGLGPTLTGAVMRMDAAANLLDGDLERARVALESARADVGAALADLRRVVYGLRPIALDKRGLVDAIKEQTGPGSPPVTLRVPARLPPLSPAVELAAYRVVMEGISNARRHSTAAEVTVALDVGADALTVTVEDDGDPPHGYRPGAGIRSIHEHVEELGGTVSIGPRESGWSVTVRLPLTTM